MKQLGHLKTYKMKLTTLSPIFIGGGETILGLKNEYDFKNKVLKNNTEMAKKWIDYFMNFKSYKNNPEYKRLIPRDAKAPSLQGFLRFIENKEFKPNKKSNKFIRENGKPFIPASSIKGAIRTALMANFISQGNNIRDAKEILKEQMKYIQISDTESISEDNFDEMKIYPQKLIQDKKVGYSPDKYGKPKTLFPKEFLYDGVDVYFYITIDTKKSKYSLEKILELLQKHYNTVCEENKAALIDTNVKICINYDGLKPNINIGGQSGFNTKVVLRSMSKDFQDYTQKKKYTLSKNFNFHSHDKVSLAPRYLKFVKIACENGNDYLTPGWCNISLAE